jgi:hypothetical protein
MYDISIVPQFSAIAGIWPKTFFSSLLSPSDKNNEVHLSGLSEFNTCVAQMEPVVLTTLKEASEEMQHSVLLVLSLFGRLSSLLRRPFIRDAL